MCGIAGLFGKATGSILIEMLKELEHRGPDGSGAYVDGKLFYGDLGQLKTLDGKVFLGQNLLSIVGSEVQQPISDEKRVLVANGEIYNFRDLKTKLKYDFKTDSDIELILALLDQYKGKLSRTLPQVIARLDGDYAFIIFDGEDWAAVRDPVGVKPLFFGKHEKNDFFGVASERKALWRVGIKNVKALDPAFMIYNQKLLPLPKMINNIDLETVHFKKNLTNYNFLKSQLVNMMVQSVKKRINGLNRVGIIFSGGLDSTILAKVCLKLGYKPELYTVGNEGSSDLKFSVKTAEILDLPIYTNIVTVEDVKRCTPLVLRAIEEWNIMKLGVGMTAYMASELAYKNGIRVLLSGQGADELFAGYHRYMRLYSQNKDSIQDKLKEDIKNMYHVNLQRDDAVTMANSVELRLPYLDLDIINMALNIPMKYKIKGEKDPLRKCILRDVAAELGVPAENVKRPKKAAQYGSGIHKILVKKVLKDEDYLENLKSLKYIS